MNLSRRILIVEDDAVAALNLEKRLKAMGYEPVGRVDSGEGALAMARQHLPDLVLMDIRLKGRDDGIDAAKQLRDELEIPVIFLTAYADNETVERARESEPYGYIAKPYSPQGLYGAIEMALYRYQIEAQLRMKDGALDSSINAVMMADLSGVIFYINPAFAHLWGYADPAEVIGRPSADIFEKEDEIELIEDALLNRNSWMGELTARRKDGGTFEVLLSASNVYGRDGTPLCFFSSFVDLTEQKQVENRLRDSVARFRLLFDSVPLPIFLADPNGQLRLSNPAVTRFLGYSAQELAHTPYDQYLHPADYDSDASLYAQLFAREIPSYTVDKRFIRKDGGIVWGRITVTLFSESGEEAPEVLVVCEDITARRQDEEMRRLSEERLHLLTDTLPGAAFIYQVGEDQKGRLTYLSPGASELLGVQPGQAEVEMDPLWDLVLPEDLPALRASYLESLRQAAPWQQEFRIQPPGQAVRWIRAQAVPLPPTGGEVLTCSGVLLDITALKERESELQASLEEKALLLREIHHRVKNNMQVVVSLLSLESGAAEDPRIKAVFEESKNRIRTMALVHENLYNTSDLARIQFLPFLERLCGGLLNSYNAGERVRCEIRGEDLSLDVDIAVPLGLIANELITNALKYAFPEGRPGVVNVSLASKGEHLVFTVADDGIGFPTDGRAAETGSLGLRLVQSLARQLDGAVEIEGDRGTLVRVTFRPAGS